MTKYYDTDTKAFYEENSTNRISITNEYWQELLIKQSNGGKIINTDTEVFCILNTEKIIDNEIVSRIDDADYIAEQRKQLIQSELAKYKNAVNDITNARLIDDLQHDNNLITDAVYNSRKTTRANQYNQVRNTYYTNTGLTPPATITA